MYSKILVPLDGSAIAELALSQAEEIAKAMGAEVLLLQVVQPPLAKLPEVGSGEESRALLEEGGRARAYLATVASRLGSAGIRCRFEVAEGPPASAIIAFARREAADIVVMSTHGRSNITKLVMGSVAEKILFACDRPVLLVRPERAAVRHFDESDIFAGAR